LEEKGGVVEETAIQNDPKVAKERNPTKKKLNKKNVRQKIKQPIGGKPDV